MRIYYFTDLKRTITYIVFHIQFTFYNDTLIPVSLQVYGTKARNASFKTYRCEALTRYIITCVFLSSGPICVGGYQLFDLYQAQLLFLFYPEPGQET